MTTILIIVISKIFSQKITIISEKKIIFDFFWFGRGESKG